MLKCASLKYDNCPMNIGECIQSLAAEQFLPRVDRHLDRDDLNQVPGEGKYLLIMNGWFTTKPENWPPSESIVPVFFGFHISRRKGVRERLLSEESIDYFKRHEPIGCRDRETERMLLSRGVRAYYSKCLTLTFPARESTPANGKVFLVDVDPDRISIPEHLEHEAVLVSHRLPQYYSHEVKSLIAEHMLDIYRKEARLVVTTRLHCALPCIAFGVPVIFFGHPNEYRVSLLRDLSVEIHEMPGFCGRRLLGFFRKLKKKCRKSPLLRRVAGALYSLGLRCLIDKKINWAPGPIPIEAEKAELIARIKDAIREKTERAAKAAAITERA